MAPSAGNDLAVDQNSVELVRISSLVLTSWPRLSGEIAEHSRLLAELNDNLPPILVHRRTMRVIDGMHRVRAAQLRGRSHIAAGFFDGSERDAFVLAVRENVAHGLPLSRGDRKAAAVRILQFHPNWSNRTVGEAAGLSEGTVRTIRRQSMVEGVSGDEKRVGRDGRTRPLNSANGRRRASALILADPGVALRAVAQASGISVSTAHDVRRRVQLGEDPVPAGQQGGARPLRLCATEKETGPAGGRTRLRALKDDPSLRYNEAGRDLLRWLDAHLVEPTDWQGWLDSVPPHCTDVVAALALESARAWQALATTLTGNAP
ncbi:ParB N-terminal domain-containing protein [Fodinicola feengrottensis]|uniref:ParB N-terminal domain-containing protein n=1 Tax=Fodinicola feengrottensis TaxID=435914 RepID=A0ABN2G1R1_9ACTN